MLVCIYKSVIPRWLSGKESPCQTEMQVLSQGQEDLLEKETATYSSILAWEISWIRGVWWATVCGVAKSWTQLSD